MRLLARSPPTACLAAGSCSYGHGFACRFFQLPPRGRRLAVALRLLSSAPMSSFHVISSGPCRGTPAHGNAVGHPHQKIRPARAHQNGPGPSQWGRRYEGAPGGLNANTGAFPRRCQGLRVGCPCGAKKAPDMGHIWYEPFRFPYDSRCREGAPRNLPAAAALLVHPTRTPARTGNPGAWSKGLASIPRESSASPRGGEGPQVPTGAGCGGRTGGCAANSNAPPHTET